MSGDWPDRGETTLLAPGSVKRRERNSVMVEKQAKAEQDKTNSNIYWWQAPFKTTLIYNFIHPLAFSWRMNNALNYSKNVIMHIRICSVRLRWRHQNFFSWNFFSWTIFLVQRFMDQGVHLGWKIFWHARTGKANHSVVWPHPNQQENLHFSTKCFSRKLFSSNRLMSELNRCLFLNSLLAAFLVFEGIMFSVRGLRFLGQLSLIVPVKWMRRDAVHFLHNCSWLQKS